MLLGTTNMKVGWELTPNKVHAAMKLAVMLWLVGLDRHHFFGILGPTLLLCHYAAVKHAVVLQNPDPASVKQH